MQTKYIKSPINYSGGKYRLLKQIIPLFPTEINTFVDLFCGAGTVGININANKIICNDLINYLPELFNTWKSKSLEEVNNHIDMTIKNNNLSPLDKEAFEKFRAKYNETKNIEDLFVLICYSFNYQMRFNNSHIYNSSFGKEASTMNDNIRNNVNNFVNAIHSKNIYYQCGDFKEFNFDELNTDDFVYCDPPYLISGAVYQDGKRGFKGWNQQDDIDLYNILDDLDKRNIKFALSNMLESKGRENEYLVNWSKKYNIHNLSMNYNGGNYQRKVNNKDVEVLITNY